MARRSGIVVSRRGKKRLDLSEVQEEIIGLLDDWGNVLIGYHERVTSTWEHKPRFEFDVIRQRPGQGGTYGLLGVAVSTDDDIYHYLNEGTGVRYATMTKDFQPKTKFRTLDSGVGKGSLAYVSTKDARAGIQARMWDDEIAKLVEKRFKQELSAAFKRGARKAKG